MNEPNDTLARRIAQHLDFGADHVSTLTRERLLEARKAALAQYQERREPVRGLAWAGATGRRDQHFFTPRYVIAAAAVVAMLIGVGYWHNAFSPGGSTIANELAEIDASLLSDELPINAYLDKGFESWLKRSSR
ncbi:MAG TPA: DUF3619 family protein [Burkholderiales bacterium]|nr:DUF3619 family protein [Burkholderiales bacterium]